MKAVALGVPVALSPRIGDAGFEEHAAPECIEAHLRDARRKLRSAEIAVSWLEGLLEERRRQVAAGLWP